LSAIELGHGKNPFSSIEDYKKQLRARVQKKQMKLASKLLQDKSTVHEIKKLIK